MNGEWALVAGASGGIGRAISLRLAADGWNIFAHYRGRKEQAEETAEAVRALGVHAVVGQADLSDAGAAARLVADASSTGALRGLIYAAGPYLYQDFISNQSPERFSSTIDSDVKAFYNLVYAAIPALRATKGAILAMVTPAIDRYPRADALSSVPKAAIQGLIRGLAVEEGRYGIRANAVGPGVLEGEGMWTELVARGDFSERGLVQAKAAIPLGRFGNVTDIAAAARFLMSDEASWITGQTLYVDGGYSV